MILRILSLVMLCTLIGCGNDHAVPNGPDMSIPDGAPCVIDADCHSATFLCAYKIADGCSAKGHCAAVPTPTCAHITRLCGCNGSPVNNSDCFYSPGFASGPTTGAMTCADGGL